MSGTQSPESEIMTHKTKLSIISIILILAIVYLPTSAGASGSSVTISQSSNSPSIIASDENESKEPGILLALSIDNLVTLGIVQQPFGNNAFVTPVPGYATAYQMALDYGTIGLLAHNYLAGQYFSQISPGQRITLIYGDQTATSFIVTQIQQYQALSPNSASSNFIDLDSGKLLTASQLFRKIYQEQTGNLVLQTCIYADQNPSWGRLFIIAEPVEQKSIAHFLNKPIFSPTSLLPLQGSARSK